MPAVQKRLLQIQCKQLQELFTQFPAIREVLINGLSIYGVPLSQVMKDVPENQQVNALSAFIEHPAIYLEEKHFPSSTIEAVRISHAAQQVQDYRILLTQRERDRERFNNVDDEARIGAVRGHFEQVIKPHFTDVFKQLTLEGVESKMRQMFLEAIKEEAQEKGQDEKAKALLAFINTLSEEEKQKLIQGQDEALMAKVREQFNDPGSIAQTAWRAYDKWAPVGSTWPNLLTPPLVGADAPITFTVRTVGMEAPTTKMASDLSREMIAYSYLLVTDPNDGDDSMRATRKTAFIAKVAEIRRAHNEPTRGMDDPSCLPGTVSRAGDMWIAHSKSIIPDAPKLLEEELRSLVLEKFQATPKEEMDKLYNGLIIFNINTVQDIIKGKVDITPEDMQFRKQFLASLGSEAEIHQTVNQRLEARGSRALSDEEFSVYVPAMLTDIGGPWISEKLTTLYRKDRQETLENPYDDYIIPQGVPVQLANRMLHEKLQAIQLERKFPIILELAQLFDRGNDTQAYEKLRSYKIDDVLLDAIQKAVSMIKEEQAEVGKRVKAKAELWDKLYLTYQKIPIENKGDTLKDIVDLVIDERKPLSEVLQEYKLPLPSERRSQRATAISPMRDLTLKQQAKETKVDSPAISESAKPPKRQL